MMAQWAETCRQIFSIDYQCICVIDEIDLLYYGRITCNNMLKVYIKQEHFYKVQNCNIIYACSVICAVTLWYGLLVLVKAAKGAVLCNILDIKYVGSVMYIDEQTLKQL
jgi:hypothetical protein